MTDAHETEFWDWLITGICLVFIVAAAHAFLVAEYGHGALTLLVVLFTAAVWGFGRSLVDYD